MQDLEFNLQIPDLWQQEAIRQLKAGRDVVVDAPTGAGKTYIFELFIQGGYRKKAIYTVPTRALANDKLLEWRNRGWEVGITTGDVSNNLEAPVIVATLETQKQRFLQGEGPGLLVVDEYQMLADPARGVNYELILALAPPQTQLLLLSGTVGNPKHVVDWLVRIGRNAALIRSMERPVPLEECFVEALPGRVPERVRGFWPRTIAKALMADLGPILVFAPRRQASENLARQLSSALPIDHTLPLSREQKRLAGKDLSKLLKNRIAFHHSGLTYRQRAALVEPLAKSGQLRVVVSTTGLAAGINFSLRSVTVTDREYRVGEFYSEIRPDELLQMFGRSGRRGLDKKGFILVTPGKPRLSEGRPMQLKRINQLEWPAIIAVMRSAVERDGSPERAASLLTERLFSNQRVPLGLNEFLKVQPSQSDTNLHSTGPTPSRQTVIEILNSQGKWERRKAPVRDTLGNALFYTRNQWLPALQIPAAITRIRVGSVCKIETAEGVNYGREVPLATVLERENGRELILTKWLHRKVREQGRHNHRNRRIYRRKWTLSRLKKEIVPLLIQITGGGRIHELVEKNDLISARLDFSEAELFVYADSEGKRLINPPQKKRDEGFDFSFQKAIGKEGPAPSPAYAWYQLGLIDKKAHPTRRGIIFSFFNYGEGLAITAALEDESYDIQELVYDLANLRAGHRFTELEAYSSRLGTICQIAYSGNSFPGYLEKGRPVDYGDGAAEVLSESVSMGSKMNFSAQNDMLMGDIERVGLEWRSLLNHISNAPEYPWKRWSELKATSRNALGSNAPPAHYADLPRLSAAQTQRYHCILRFR